MRPDADIVIVGAGCAGLSLAVALGAARVPGRTLLLEPRSLYTRDRTWSFWNTEEHPFTTEISHSWHSWRVALGAAAVTQSSRRYRYCSIAGDAFYRAALDRIEREPAQELERATTVLSVEPHANGLTAVETSRGRVLARQVFDSRPAMHAVRGSPALVQRFVGWHVRTATPGFDPQVVELMRFLPSDRPGRVRFLYLLPYSASEALVEMTYLDSPGLPEPEYRRDLENWLADNVGAWTVLGSEHGSLPMQSGFPQVSSQTGVSPIGSRAGRVKPSSGYAFLRIQRHSRAIAGALLQGRPIPAEAESPLFGVMDAVFLRAVVHAPELAAALFLSMFTRAEPDALVRFLGEVSGPSEMLRVAWSLPKLPLMRAALSAAGAGVRAYALPRVAA